MWTYQNLMYMYMCMHMCVRVRMRVCMCMCVCVCVCMNTCVHRAINLASANMKKDVDVLQLLPHASLELLVTESAISERPARKVCCSMLQCVACSSALHCGGVCFSVLELLVTEGSTSQSAAHKVCCSVLQYVAVCCSMLQCVAV